MANYSTVNVFPVQAIPQIVMIKISGISNNLHRVFLHHTELYGIDFGQVHHHIKLSSPFDIYRFFVDICRLLMQTYYALVQCTNLRYPFHQAMITRLYTQQMEWLEKRQNSTEIERQLFTSLVNPAFSCWWPRAYDGNVLTLSVSRLYQRPPPKGMASECIPLSL